MRLPYHLARRLCDGREMVPHEPAQRAFLEEVLALIVENDLRPVATTGYQREPFVGRRLERRPLVEAEALRVVDQRPRAQVLADVAEHGVDRVLDRLPEVHGAVAGRRPLVGHGGPGPLGHPPAPGAAPRPGRRVGPGRRRLRRAAGGRRAHRAAAAVPHPVRAPARRTRRAPTGPGTRASPRATGRRWAAASATPCRRVRRSRCSASRRCHPPRRPPTSCRTGRPRPRPMPSARPPSTAAGRG